MKSPLSALLGLLVLAGCALDIPAPAAPPPAAKAEYDVVSDGGTVVRHFDGNDALVWIERHVLSPGTGASDPRIKTYHSNAADTLQWYEYRRWETVGRVWVKTREQHFTAAGNAAKDNGVLSSAKAWTYAGNGLPVLTAYYNATEALVGYDSVWAEAAAGDRVLQKSTHDAGGLAQSYDRTWFEPGLPGKKTAHILFNGSRLVDSAQSWDYEGDNWTQLLEYSASGLWSREQRGYLPGASTPYRTIWYKATGAAPAAAEFEASPVPASPALGNSAVAAGSLEPVVLPVPPGNLLALPSLNAPASWPLSTLQGFEYVLPGSNGTTKIRFDKDRLPTTLQRAAQGPLGAMEVAFAWDAEKRLTKRVVQYAGNPVLTVDLRRDASGRIDRVSTAGSLLKVPLTYTLTYDGTASRPDTLVLSTGTQALMTLGFTYDDKTAALGGDAGLGVLNFDTHLRTLSAALDGGADRLPVLDLEFPLSASNPAAIAVYDTLGKTKDARKLIGTLTWSWDAGLHQTGLVWKLASNTTLTADWTYTAGWGTWAALAAGMTTTAADTGASLEADASGALALADSFDVDKIFQLVNAVRAQANQAQYQRMASSLLDQVKAASGN